MAVQEMALYRLKRIAYLGEDFEAALMTLKASEHSDLAQSAEAVLGKLRSI
jgi:hypothetical protein